MREILFRGKRVDKGEWVEGYFWIGANLKTYIKYKETYGAIDGSWVLIDIEVIPESVGQFIGLLDKSSKKIFEGDIVSVRGTKRVGLYETEIIFAGQGFRLKENRTYLNDFMEWPSIQFVIGNIHDNPELRQ